MSINMREKMHENKMLILTDLSLDNSKFLRTHFY